MNADVVNAIRKYLVADNEAEILREAADKAGRKADRLHRAARKVAEVHAAATLMAATPNASPGNVEVGRLARAIFSENYQPTYLAYRAESITDEANPAQVSE